MSNILIYSGEGVSAYFLRHVVRYIKRSVPDCLQDSPILRVDDNYLKEDPSWEENTLLLVIPGGSDRPYHRKLTGKGTFRIAEFIRNGGSYLGICAGAYFASSFVHFKETEPEKNIIYDSRELHFFPGIAKGPIYNREFSYRHFRGVCPALLELSANSKGYFYALYHGGCYFVDAEKFPGITIECRYSDIKNTPAAIVSTRVGRGKVVLSGVHIEYQPDFCGIQDPWVQKAKDMLITEENRQATNAFSKRLFEDFLLEETLPARP